jgi:glycerol-3-phosphate dehydrogenase
VDLKEDRSTTWEGLDFVWESANRLVRELPSKSKIIKAFAGLRPEPPNEDFIIEAHHQPWGFINVAGMRSPGFTSAPAIACYVKSLIEEIGVKLVDKELWNPFRRMVSRPKGLLPEKREELIKQDPRYGNIVCICKKQQRLKSLRRSIV